jgi:hypothetical protein
MLVQDSHSPSVKCHHSPASIGLRQAKLDLPTHHYYCLKDTELGPLEVDVTPAEAEKFTSAQPGSSGEMEGCIVLIAPRRRQKGAKFIRRPRGEHGRSRRSLRGRICCRGGIVLE